MTTMTGNKKNITIKQAGEISITDTSTSTTYTIKNKTTKKYGTNTFNYSASPDAIWGKDVIQGYNSEDALNFDGEVNGFTYSKKGTSNDFVITKNNKSSITLKNYFKNTANSLSLGDIPINTITVAVNGSGKIYGTDLNDNIKGGNKADKITTGDGKDTIQGNKGNDTITISGSGKKTISINQGDGNDIINVRKDIDDANVNLKFNPINNDDNINYAYSRKYTNLTVTATHANGKKESVTLNNYFNFDVPFIGNLTEGSYDSVTLNEANDIEDILYDNDTRLNIEGVKVSQLLKNFNVSKMLKQAGYSGIKIPSALTGINLFLGSDYNADYKGTSGKDLMISTGGNNNFITGTKGQTVIASLSGIQDPDEITEPISEHDSYTINSFTAGTLIVDAGGENDLTIKGVDVNNLHMASYMQEPGEIHDGLDLSDISIAYLTDKKGISTFKNLNYSGIYKNVMGIVNPENEISSSTIKSLQKKYGYGTAKFNETKYENAIYSKAKKIMINNINSVVKTATSLISNFRGVALVGFADRYEEVYNEYTDNYENMQASVGSDILAKDIKVVDTKGNEQIIANSDMHIYQDIMVDKIVNYLDSMQTKYASHIHKLLGNDYSISESIVNFAQYILVAPQAKKFQKADKSIYSKIKSGFFNIFENMYIGTSGNNSYTIKKTENGAVIVSGTGNDTFVFKDAIADKSGTNYLIVSNLNDTDKDTIKFTNYSFDSRTLLTNANIEETLFNGIDIFAVNSKKAEKAQISYSLAEDTDLTQGKFDNLTIEDSTKKKFNVTAEYDENEINYDWTADDEKNKNHIAVTKADNTTVKSGNTSNILLADTKNLLYTYGKGNDVVVSMNDISDDSYNVDFGKNTKLLIMDKGGDDIIHLTADLSKTNLFFNVKKDGSYDNVLQFIADGNLTKSNITKETLDGDSVLLAKKGMAFNDIEQITVNENDFNYEEAINAIKESVSGWLSNSKKGYADVNDVFSRGADKEIKAVLALYDKVDLTQYQALAS